MNTTRLAPVGDPIARPSSGSDATFAVEGGYLEIVGSSVRRVEPDGSVVASPVRFESSIFSGYIDGVRSEITADGGLWVFWNTRNEGSKAWRFEADGQPATESPISPGEGEFRLLSDERLLFVRAETSGGILREEGTGRIFTADGVVVDEGFPTKPGVVFALGNGGFGINDTGSGTLFLYDDQGNRASARDLGSRSYDHQFSALGDDLILEIVDLTYAVRDGSGEIVQDFAPFPDLPARAEAGRASYVLNRPDGSVAISVVADLPGRNNRVTQVIDLDEMGTLQGSSEVGLGSSVREIAPGVLGYGFSETVGGVRTNFIQRVEYNAAPEGTVTITGSATEGATLTASVTVTDPDGTTPGFFTWERQGRKVAEGAEYIPDQKDVGRTLTAIYSYVDGATARESITSEPTDPVADTDDAPEGVLRAALPVIEKVDRYDLSDGGYFRIFVGPYDSDERASEPIVIERFGADGSPVSYTEIAARSEVRGGLADADLHSARILEDGTLLIALGSSALRIDPQGDIVASYSGGVPEFAWGWPQWSSPPVELPNGDIALSWTAEDPRRVSAENAFARVFGADGTPRTDAFLLSERSVRSDGTYNPSIALRPDGTYVAAWLKEGGPDNLVVAFYEPDGTRIRTEIPAQRVPVPIYLEDPGDPRSFPAIHVQPDSSFLIVYGTDDIWATEDPVLLAFDANGALVEEATPLTLGVRVLPGQEVVADLSELSDADGLPETFSYQWLRDGVPIAGATAESYIARTEDIRADLGLRVTYVDLQGNDSTFDTRVVADVVTELRPARITGTNAPERLVGDMGNETIGGLGGDDTLVGRDGADVLRGGGGNDHMIGGPGSDTYVVTETGDTIDERAAWAGHDLVRTTVSYSLVGIHVEDATVIRGAEGVVLTGNELDNVLTGGAAGVLRGRAGNDTLIGGAGDDRIEGGRGRDSMEGGAGDDTYYVDHQRDVIRDISGTDRVFVSGGVEFHVAGTGVERIEAAAGGGRVWVYGDARATEIVGNAADNVLISGGGADTMTGGAGKDFFAFQATEARPDAVITDFDAADKLLLDDRFFGLGGGRIDLRALDPSDVLGLLRDGLAAFDARTKTLSVDLDGPDGPGGLQPIVSFEGRPALDLDDIMLF